MKKIIFLSLSMGLLLNVMGQLTVKTKCPDFVVDILNGKVNGSIKPGFTVGEIKNALPCFTSAEEEGPNAKCGGGVFYKDKDIYFYTQRDYIEIGEKFKGKLSIPLLGAKRNSLFRTLGNPIMKDESWDAYQTSYGTLVLHFNAAGKVKKIQFSSRTTDVLNLCE